MATAKKSAKNNKLKIGKSITINKWLALGFVAAVVASAIVIVRYSSASGTVYSVHSTRVDTHGGEIHQKSNGSWYWLGKAGSSVTILPIDSGTYEYCAQGSFGAKGTKVVIGTDVDPSWKSVSGDKGTYEVCVPASTKIGKIVTVRPVSGVMVFNRFVVNK